MRSFLNITQGKDGLVLISEKIKTIRGGLEETS